MQLELGASVLLNPKRQAPSAALPVAAAAALLSLLAALRRIPALNPKYPKYPEPEPVVRALQSDAGPASWHDRGRDTWRAWGGPGAADRASWRHASWHGAPSDVAEASPL